MHIINIFNQLNRVHSHNIHHACAHSSCSAYEWPTGCHSRQTAVQAFQIRPSQVKCREKHAASSVIR